MNYFWFLALGTLSYVGIAYMGQLGSSNATTVWQAVLNAFQPLTLAVLLVANGLWIISAYYGLKETRLAMPILIAIGVIVSYGFSLAFVGAELSQLKLAGLALILAGICLMA